jgi:hypothetical protein
MGRLARSPTYFVAMIGIAGCGAQAQNFPDYDRYAYCQKLAGSYDEKTSKFLNEGCMHNEEEDWLYTNRIWSDVQGSIREYCLRAMRSADGLNSYSLLRGCITNETSGTTRFSEPAPRPAPTGPQWYLHTPAGSEPHGSLFECSNARAKSKAAWAVCSNRY